MSCRRLIRTGDADACRDPRPHNESALAIPTGERLEGDLLRAALSKKAALISCLPLAAAALLMAGTFGLVLAAGGQGTEQAAANERNGLFGKRIGLNQAAVELQVSFVLLLRVHMGALQAIICYLG